jgi:hypothetical protein
MKKIDVVLLAVLDNGKEQIEPGETVSMDEGEARQLATLGMVQLPSEAAPAKGKKKPAKKTGGDDGGQGADDDSGNGNDGQPLKGGRREP